MQLSRGHSLRQIARYFGVAKDVIIGGGAPIDYGDDMADPKLNDKPRLTIEIVSDVV